MVNGDVCKVNNISQYSSLFLTITAGTLALPYFIKYSDVKETNTHWDVNDRTNINIEIGKPFKFHSIFVCPVSKDIAQPDNPPCLLKCGHVISSHSLKKMTANGRIRFKCPICPKEQKKDEVKPIFF